MSTPRDGASDAEAFTNSVENEGADDVPTEMNQRAAARSRRGDRVRTNEDRGAVNDAEARYGVDEPPA